AKPNGKDAAGDYGHRAVAAQRVVATALGDGAGTDRGVVRQHAAGAARDGPETARPPGGERVRVPRPDPVAPPLPRRREARGTRRQPPAGRRGRTLRRRPGPAPDPPGPLGEADRERSRGPPQSARRAGRETPRQGQVSGERGWP